MSSSLSYLGGVLTIQLIQYVTQLLQTGIYIYYTEQ
jgi:hypothetical protein